MKKALLVILSMTLMVSNCMVSLGSEDKDTITHNGTNFTGGKDKTGGGEVNTSDGTSKRKVQVNITDPDDVYSVDVTWGSMVFEYSSSTWNASNHSYGDTEWSVSNDANNNITVTNHSNVDIKVKMNANLTKLGEYEIKGKFSELGTESGAKQVVQIDNTATTTPSVGVETVSKGEVNKVNDAPTMKRELCIGGIIGNNFDGTNDIGTVTVTILK